MNSAFRPAVGTHRLADLAVLRAAVASSAIIVAAPPADATAIPNWASRRKSADVESLILSWIARHAPAARYRGRIH